MKENLVNALVIAPINKNYFGRNVFVTFLVQEQKKKTLKVLPLWWEDFPESEAGKLDGYSNAVREISVDDIWVFPTSISKAKEDAFKKDGITYRFHQDDQALERLARKLDMDRLNIGYDGEPEEGTFFNCCRTTAGVKEIIPDGLHLYSVRSSDEDDSQPAVIKNWVMVNHYGDILTDRVLPVPMQLEVEHIDYDEEGNIV